MIAMASDALIQLLLAKAANKAAAQAAKAAAAALKKATQGGRS